jgi:sarcosine oxidase
MPAAFQAWKSLEADAGHPLYLRTGGVSFSPAGVDYVAQVAANLEAMNVPHRRMTGAEWNRVNLAFHVPSSHDVVFEPDAGMLAAARAVALQVALARSHGGDRTWVLAETPVRRIELDGPRPVVLTDDLAITTERLIVTAGAWVNRLLPELPVPLKVTHQQVLYFRPHDLAPFEVGRFPVFIFKGAGSLDAFYGMPGLQGLGVKVARHGGPEIDPDLEDRGVSGDYRTVVRDFLSDHLPALARAPIEHSEVCLYTMELEERFLVDFLPGRSDVVVASPCSGHGFKFSCLIGRVLADLATRGETKISIDAWRFG